LKTGQTQPASRGPEARNDRFGEIVAGAARAFRAKGFAGASMQDIASESGMLKGSLYNYIRSKDDLLFWLVENFHGAMLANMEHVQALEADTLTKLRVLIEGHVRLIQDAFDRGLGFMADYRHLPENRSRPLIAERRSYERYLRHLITTGQHNGTICVDLDPDLTEIAILTMLNAIFLWYDPKRLRWYDDESPAAGKFALLAPSWADMILKSLACTPEQHTTGHLRALGGGIPFGEAS
jgi:AcrR family transcriptional regulator